MDTSWKFSRARAASLAAAAVAHVLLVYLLILLGTRTTPQVPFVTPIEVRLIDRPRPPLEVPVTVDPKLAKVQVRPPQVPDFHIDVPAEPVLSAKADTAVAGSPGLPGSTNQAGGPMTLTIIHYVAPAYSPHAIRAGEHGRIVMAIQVDARGTVDQVKVLHSTGSSQLDRAAVRAALQWKFAPDNSGARSEPVWGQVRLLFAPPQRLVHIPIIVMPYAAVARDVDAEIATNHEGYPDLPSGEGSVRSLLQKLVVAFASDGARKTGTNPDSVGDSVEAELGLLGSIQSLRFLGFVAHGIDRDRSDPSDLQDTQRLEKARWEVYDVEQDHGSAVWLVAVTGHGSIQRIEVAMR